MIAQMDDPVKETLKIDNHVKETPTIIVIH